MRYYIVVGGQKLGPFEQVELRELLDQGAIDRACRLGPEDDGPTIGLNELFTDHPPAVSGSPGADSAFASFSGYPAAAIDPEPAPVAAPPAGVSWTVLAGSAFMAVLAVFFFTRRNGWTFFDGVDLIIHEAGHPIFALGGEFIGFAGGTILQLLAPIAFGAYFLRRGKAFSVQFSFLWLGQSLLNVARYAGDARAMQLELVGGGIHDWNYMLGELGLLQKDTAIAGFFTIVAVLAFILAVTWPWVARHPGSE